MMKHPMLFQLYVSQRISCIQSHQFFDLNNSHTTSLFEERCCGLFGQWKRVSAAHHLQNATKHAAACREAKYAKITC